jgi:hypothetical protein
MKTKKRKRGRRRRRRQRKRNLLTQVIPQQKARQKQIH